MRKLFVSVLVLLKLIIFSGILYSNDYYIGVSTGYSMFQMSDFRDNTLMIHYKSIGLPSVSNYPHTVFGKLKLYMIRDGRMQVGLNLRSESTGASSGLKDYSGEIKVEQVLQGYSAGVSSFINLNPESDINLYLGGEIGLTFSELEVFQKVVLPDEMSSGASVEDFTNFYIQPTVMVNYPYKNFIFGMSVELYIGLEENPFFDTYNSFIAGNWTGLRLGLDVSYRLFGSPSEKE